jgi:hypothetical protein
MKPLLVLGGMTLLAGCAKDTEDRIFFEQGWLKPERAAEIRMYGEREKVSLKQLTKAEKE